MDAATPGVRAGGAAAGGGGGGDGDGNASGGDDMYITVLTTPARLSTSTAVYCISPLVYREVALLAVGPAICDSVEVVCRRDVIVPCQ